MLSIPVDSQLGEHFFFLPLCHWRSGSRKTNIPYDPLSLFIFSNSFLFSFHTLLFFASSCTWALSAFSPAGFASRTFLCVFFFLTLAYPYHVDSLWAVSEELQLKSFSYCLILSPSIFVLLTAVRRKFSPTAVTYLTFSFPHYVWQWENTYDFVYCYYWLYPFLSYLTRAHRGIEER